MRNLDHTAVDDDGVDVTSLRLGDHGPVGGQERIHGWRRIVLDQHQISLLTWFEAAGYCVQSEGLTAAPGRPGDYALRTQVVMRDGLVAAVSLQMLARPVGAE